MKKILFVCLGNVARSQMAEAFYNHFTKSQSGISAGVLDYTPKKYGHPIREVIEVMREEGLDVAQQQVKEITPEMAAEADDIFVMCQREECPDFLLSFPRVTFWDIADPFGTHMDSFRSVRDEIKKKILSILS